MPTDMPTAAGDSMPQALRNALAGQVWGHVPIPCIQGYFGDHLLTFQTQVSVKQIRQVLGHDPRSSRWAQLPKELREIYEKIQRKTSTARGKSAENYIQNRIRPGAMILGAFPPICLGMTKACRFNVIEGAAPVGILYFDMDGSNTRIVLDGLGRLTAALDMLEESEESADWYTLPVILYAPESKSLPIEDLGQLFHDFNLLRTSVTKAHAITLDQSDPHNQIARGLASKPTIKNHGGMELKARSLGHKSTAIVTLEFLLTFVKGACGGKRAAEKTLPDVTPMDLKEITERADSLENFLAHFALAMGPRFEDRHDSIHTRSLGWHALGRLYYAMKEILGFPDNEIAKFAEALGQIDWSVYNPMWIPNLGEAGDERDAQGRPRVKTVTRRQTHEWFVKHLADQIGLTVRFTDEQKSLL